MRIRNLDHLNDLNIFLFQKIKHPLLTRQQGGDLSVAGPCGNEPRESGIFSVHYLVPEPGRGARWARWARWGRMVG